MDNWSEQIIRNLEKELEGIPDRKLQFFRFDELKRNIGRIGKNEAECKGCADFKPEIESLSGTLPEAIDVPGSSRRELDRLIFRLSNHMMKEHGLFPPHRFGYVFSLTGIASGLLAGLILMKVIPEFRWHFLVAGIVFGLVFGWILGSIKDHKIKREGRLI